MAIGSQDCGVQRLNPLEGIVISVSRVIRLGADRWGKQEAVEQQTARICHGECRHYYGVPGSNGRVMAPRVYIDMTDAILAESGDNLGSGAESSGALGEGSIAIGPKT